MKKLLIGFSIVLASTMSQAAYMYWQLDDTDEQFAYDEGNNYYTFNGHQITDAQVWITDGNTTTKLTSYWQDGEKATGITPSDATYYIALDDMEYGAYSFYVELTGYDSAVYGANTGVIGSTAEPVKYADMAGYITKSLTVPPAIWTGGAYAVPEPTSGLLMMMGLALLSLKRRKE